MYRDQESTCPGSDLLSAGVGFILAASVPVDKFLNLLVLQFSHFKNEHNDIIFFIRLSQPFNNVCKVLSKGPGLYVCVSAHECVYYVIVFNF